MMNQIGTIKFDFQMQNEDFARELYARWNSFFAANFERIADEVLSKLEISNEELVIEKLDLDLGNILEQDFDEQFPLRVREKQEEAFIQWKIENEKRSQTLKGGFLYTNSDYSTLAHETASLSSQISTAQTFSTLNFQLSILEEFLLHGTLPWNTPAEYKDISYLFLTVLQQEELRFKQFLQTYGHYTSLQERFVYQLNDPELEKGVQLLEPANAGFICSYVHLLHAKYKQIEQPELPETAYRNTVWLVVYAYLLNNRSSYFDKKTFLSLTILRLSVKNNLSYDRLLEIITHDLEIFFKRLPIPTVLFKILKDLRDELSKKQFNRSAFSAAKFYQTIAGLLQKEIKKGVNEHTKESLIIILSRPDSCRIFLQPLKEEETYRLVEVIIPNDSEFIIETAKSLDKLGIRNEKLRMKKDTLQSIPNSKIKWQLIFPLLLENKGATFNRKYFVENLFKQAAAHYNLSFLELIAYIYENPTCFNLFDNPLKKIIEELYLMENGELKMENVEFIPRWRGQGVENSTKDKESESGKIEKKKQQNHSQLSILNSQLNKSLSTFTFQLSTDEEHYELVRKYFPNDSEFIITYAKQLDTAYEKGFLEGQTSSEFCQLKWRFIFTVLAQLPEHSFNRRYFVEQTLQRIAAHYNLDYFELLAYFQTAEAAIHLPFELQTVLTELFYEEKEHWISIALHNSNEIDKFNILKILFPAEEKFVKTYMQALDYHHEKGALQGKTSGNFHQIKWKFIFEVVFEAQKVAFNKKQFIARTLAKLAAHYNLAMQDVLSWLCADTGFASALAYKEIGKIFTELYNAQKTKKSTAEKNNATFIQKYLLQHPVSNNERILFEKLCQQTAFIAYIAEIIARLPELRKFLKTNFQLSISNETILQFLLQTATRYHSLSQAEIGKQLLEMLTNPLDKQQKKLVMRNEKLGIQDEKDYSLLIPNYSLRNGKSLKKEQMKKEETNNEELETTGKENSQLSILNYSPSAHETATLSSQFINNAGMALLFPYFSRLFIMLDLVEHNTTFKNQEAQIRAMFLLQYVVFGSSLPCGEGQREGYPEHEMTLNKLVTAFETGQPIPKSIDLTDKEKETVESLLKAALQNWPKLSRTSIDGLREGFLQREGKLEEKEDYYLLTVQEKAYDMLLDNCPWNFKTIRYPWMKKMIQVKWR